MGKEMDKESSVGWKENVNLKKLILIQMRKFKILLIRIYVW